MEAPPDPVRWIQTWTGGHTGTFRIGRAADRLVAEWVGVATLRAGRSGDRVEFRIAPGCDVSRAEKLRRSTAEALLRHLAGATTLHASVVGDESGAVALLGESGAGKSTLAAALSRQANLDFVGDDTASLTLGNACAYVEPTESCNWLAPDACEALGFIGKASEKVPTRPTQVATRPTPLRALVKLCFENEHAVRRLTGREAFQALSQSLFRFVLDEPNVTLRDFAQLEHLCMLVPTYELRRPRDLSQLTVSRLTIEEILKAPLSPQR